MLHRCQGLFTVLSYSEKGSSWQEIIQSENRCVGALQDFAATLKDEVYTT